MPKALPRPAAESKSISDLIKLVMSGRIRIPVCQRDLQWGAEDVIALFDSIYRGYPVGSLLFHKHSAPAQNLELGPLLIHAQEESAALDVVDGQQRLVALAASLMRPLPIPTTPDDPFVIYFDPRAEKFCGPPRTGEIPNTWVPLPHLSDRSRLVEWAFNWAHGRDEPMRRTLFEAGTRIREYEIPAYTVEVDDQDYELLGDIFHRINSSGKSLKWPVIYNALYSARGGGDEPSTLEELAEALTPLGMGLLNAQDLLRCLIAFEGRDVTRSFDFLDGTAAQALPTLRRVLSFLRSHGRIVHERLLPRTAPLTILTRFFRLHPEPKARSLELLTRWLWRSLLANKLFDERTFQRRGISEISDDEERSIQRLLAFLPKDDPGLTLPQSFDAHATDSRIALLGLVSLEPRDLDTGRPLDVAALIERSDREAFRQVLNTDRRAPSEAGGAGAPLSSPANRILLPGKGLARAELLAHIQAAKHGDSVLLSHAITPAAAAALVAGEYERFSSEREHSLQAATRSFTKKLAGWSLPDRPSIDYILDAV